MPLSAKNQVIRAAKSKTSDNRIMKDSTLRKIISAAIPKADWVNLDVAEINTKHKGKLDACECKLFVVMVYLWRTLESMF
jgi:hypothetical protein